MADSNANSAHWCKSVVEQAMYNPSTSSQSTAASWNYPNPSLQAYTTASATNLGAPTAAAAANAYGGVIASSAISSGYSYAAPPSSSSSVSYPQSSYATTSASTTAAAAGYGYSAASAYYGAQQPVAQVPLVSPTPSAYAAIAGVPQYSFPISQQQQQYQQHQQQQVTYQYPTSQVVRQPVPTVYSSTMTTTGSLPSQQQQQQPPQQQIIYMPHTNLAAKKPNPSRFSTVAAPTTISAPASASSAAFANTEIPPNLRAFIKRSLASCQSEVERKLMTVALGNLVAGIKSDYRTLVYKWETEPIPKIPLPEPETTSTLPPTVKLEPQASVISYGFSANANDGDNNKKRKSRWDPDEDGNITLSAAGKKIKTEPTISVSSSSFSKIIEPQLTPEESSLRQQRANRFQFGDNNSSNSSNSNTALSSHRGLIDTQHLSKKQMKKIQQQQQQQIQSQKKAKSVYAPVESEEFDIESLRIVGTCLTLEKEYFRLTTAPDPSTVRPLDVLRKALLAIKKKWISGSVEYIQICSQLKAVRQDLTVQDIRNEFMVEVYETHARIALECGDLNEYNQCQTQLKQLYDSGLPGAEMEFTAYRILYYVYLQGNKKYQKGSSDLSGILISLSDAAKRSAAVIHALRVRQAIRRENFHQFFQLYKVTPNMGSYILDQMLDGLRLQVLTRMCKAYKPHLEESWVIDELGFEDTVVGQTFLQRAGCVVVEQDIVSEGNSGIETESRSATASATAMGKKTTAFMKERVIIIKDSVIDPAAVLTQDKLLL